MICRIIKRSMSQTAVGRIMNNADKAETRLGDLRCQLREIVNIKIGEKIKYLTEENKILAAKVEVAKADLIKLEILNGKKQYTIPGKIASGPASLNVTDNVTEKVNTETKKPKDNVKKTKEKTETVNDSVVDIRKLDLRIGKILTVNKHPDADSLYVEKIDCGEDTVRTVVSGLVNHVPINEMQDRVVMVLCNLKPVKMRGVTSEAMVMCASSPDKVEVLIPPQNAAPGDLVECEGYPREPEAVLNPKKKIFETCSPDLMTNEDRVACYKGKPLFIPGKGPILAPTLKGVNVK